MGVNLLFSTLILSLIIGLFHTSIWLSYALILVLLGGLLVIFVYVSLLASNETLIRINKIYSLIFFSSPALIFFIFNPYQREVINFKLNLNHSIKFNWLTDFYSITLGSLTIFLLFYLLLTLLVVVYNTKNKHATLRRNL